MNTIKTVTCLVVLFLLMDCLWLGFIAKDFYIRYMGHLLNIKNGSIQAQWSGAVLVYFALVLGIMLFVIPLSNGHVIKAFMYGALYGFVTYSTYDATCLAVIKDWPVVVTVVDIVWGMIICSLSSGLTVWIVG